MSSLRLRIRSEEGFTMIIALGVMFVTSLLMVAAFTIAEGEVQLSRADTTQKQAYYAALSGIQQYEYKLQAEPDYWETCEGLESKVPAKESSQEVERYVVTPVVAASAAEGAKCNKSEPAAAMIQTKGPFENTFRIKSVGEVTVNGKRTETRSVIATFGVTNFLDYVYYTNFETEDPGLYKASEPTLAKECEGKYYEQWSKEKLSCKAINFKPGDQIEGPLHTNDTARVEGGTFGRKGHEPKDKIEMYGGTYGPASGCTGATYYTTSGCYTTKVQLVEKLDPPPGDETLAAYVEPKYKFEGRTVIELKGTEMLVHWHDKEGGEHSETMALPPNGLIYVADTVSEKHSCEYEFEVENSDTSSEPTEEEYCGNVYVKGNYSSSLTIAGQDDVIVNGSVYPTGTSLGSKPTGTSVLGLIAGDYARVYHPCSGGKNGTGSFTNPWIYAAILATKHSWTVDNHSCGSSEGELNVYGSIAQNYRGVVLVGSSGYVKNYEYDERLATDEPPYFLAPLKAGWKIVRETAPSAG